MPSKSAKQHRLMAMVAHDPKAAKRLGIPQSVGRDYVEADKGRKFGSGGSMDRKSMNMSRARRAAGRAMRDPSADMMGRALMRRPAPPMDGMGGGMPAMKKGGKAESKEMMKKEVAFMKKKGAPKSMVKHEEAEMKSEKKMRGGGKAYSGGGGVYRRAADGVASKGKTKGKFV